ncbi:MAG: Hsp20/alpha crystallin family protein [Deltaproteobacteria bacterium]|nr:Hsp20/alpha crystallin family protein [Deltaproteobacteria bacterium]
MLLRRLAGFPGLDLTSPFSEIERMRQEMDRLFENLAGGLLRETIAGVFPLTNVTEDKDNFYVRAELPGISKDELEISVTNDTLSISGERKIPEEGENVRYHRKEREEGRFSRIITLPSPIDTEKVEASCENGVLTVVLPKVEEAKPRQIKVKA